jgi:hypothetical protein
MPLRWVSLNGVSDYQSRIANLLTLGLMTPPAQKRKFSDEVQTVASKRRVRASYIEDREVDHVYVVSQHESAPNSKSRDTHAHRGASPPGTSVIFPTRSKMSVDNATRQLKTVITTTS